MKVLVIGATGTIGSALVESLKQGNKDNDIQVIAVGRGTKPDSAVKLDYIADFENIDSIEAVLKEQGTVDAIVNFAGTAALGKVFGDESMTSDEYNIGFQSKLMGQVKLAKLAVDYLAPGGSITLTSGETSSVPVLGMTAAGMVNAAIDTFVQGAALELTDGKRINSVSPGMIKQSMELIPGADTTGTVDLKKVVQTYCEVIMDSSINGQKLVVSTEDNAIALKAFGEILASMPKQ
ncbi:short chain dehydrogenase [Photobacterium alginatilyticum]|uniref:Short chain dehydrogenase n=1 Tax=Photobacterium alginatilyticum TaxID=1775171 RepID=A0ABW9YEZ4_9GAMM|nr:short chain dehydrogenase [Photobacterium alginatilyticum]NBI51813.1 short chain dehydrogenase [Photobacterium alginatilyticum]